MERIRPHGHNARVESRARFVGRFVWILIPIISMSFLSWVPAAQIYWRARTAGWLITTAALALTSAAIVAGMATDTAGAVFGWLIIGAAVGGTTAAVSGHEIVFDRKGPETDPAVHEALENRERRKEAKGIAESDPQLAIELGIGRPELRRSHRTSRDRLHDQRQPYDDGGMIDLNNATADSIIDVLGWDAGLVSNFVNDRELRRGYTSFTELQALSRIDPQLIEAQKDRIVVLPYQHAPEPPPS
ncbi:hypothetical protein EF847_15040 [Actinobacteria bacterium YIM 96077]|uniref:Helix-hairpin-helix domain-containing protein n=1 Tax=Phytoactinopolyspora halophila TaxID=1981511 RepID=A0A329QT95_9ACTN|nr:hypothetical protein [Phytoactinopolyspora halophila]AYY13816.1 hypothetical protein EF847_15040 [Actinobacteria bacterium YIM 96077]RAW15640.1 hypothetical protein DPM12_08300 [Phytoactinopolyspora halophila]